MARAAYEERSFARLPFPGDALEEAGCTVEHILAHPRDNDRHVRECWAPGLVLDKD